MADRRQSAGHLAVRPHPTRRFHSPRYQWIWILVVGICAAREASPQQRVPAADVLTRVAAYIARYEDQMAFIVADEHYEQRVYEVPPYGSLPNAQPSVRQRLAKRRRLDSELLMLRLPSDDSQWIAVRQVMQADGKTVSRADDRLERLRHLSYEEATTEWQQIAADNAAYNIGPTTRTFNVPGFALRFLRSENQGRFTFLQTAERASKGARQVRLSFVEHATPTFVRDATGQRSLPCRGTIWVDLADGAVVETELLVADDLGDQAQARVIVTFGKDPKSSTLVPLTMRERYDAASGARTEGTAAYSNIRRFEVDARWKVAPR